MPICSRCSSTRVLYVTGSRWVQCNDCGHRGPEKGSEAGKFDAWYTYVPPTPGPADRLKERIQDRIKEITESMGIGHHLEHVDAAPCPTCGGTLKRIREGRLCVDCGAFVKEGKVGDKKLPRVMANGPANVVVIDGQVMDRECFLSVEGKITDTEWFPFGGFYSIDTSMGIAMRVRFHGAFVSEMMPGADLLVVAFSLDGADMEVVRMDPERFRITLIKGEKRVPVWPELKKEELP